MGLKNNMLRVLRGFSLVELMVTLIIVSCVISAMTPMITKKLKLQSVTVGSSGGSQGSLNVEFSSDCTAFGVDCALCLPNKCAMCTKNCLDSEFVDTPTCTCKSCNNFGEKCLECGMQQCRKCQNGYYIDGIKCTICPLGNYCDGVNKTICPEGKYTDSEGQASCKECEVGYACTNGIKTACNAGSYSSASLSNCLICPVGYFCAGTTDKTVCSENQYQDTEGQTNCKTCPEGSYVSNDRVDCNICEIGYKCTGDGTKTQCSKGTYSSNTGSITCSTCTKGYYCPGGTKVSCPVGTYSDTTGNQRSLDCKSCADKTANCSDCNRTTGICTKCQSDYVLSNAQCIKNCSVNYYFEKEFADCRPRCKHLNDIPQSSSSSSGHQAYCQTNCASNGGYNDYGFSANTSQSGCLGGNTLVCYCNDGSKLRVPNSLVFWYTGS